MTEARQAECTVFQPSMGQYRVEVSALLDLEDFDVYVESPSVEDWLWELMSDIRLFSWDFHGVDWVTGDLQFDFARTLDEDLAGPVGTKHRFPFQVTQEDATVLRAWVHPEIVGNTLGNGYGKVRIGQGDHVLCEQGTTAHLAPENGFWDETFVPASCAIRPAPGAVYWIELEGLTDFDGFVVQAQTAAGGTMVEAAEVELFNDYVFAESQASALAPRVAERLVEVRIPETHAAHGHQLIVSVEPEAGDWGEVGTVELFGEHHSVSSGGPVAMTFTNPASGDNCGFFYEEQAYCVFQAQMIIDAPVGDQFRFAAQLVGDSALEGVAGVTFGHGMTN